MCEIPRISIIFAMRLSKALAFVCIYLQCDGAYAKLAQW